MKKKSSTKKFIQSCYYKFRAHKSLVDITPNPLLAPTETQQGSLCPFSLKRDYRSYHHKTVNDWASTSLNNFTKSRLLKSKNANKEDIKKMEDIIVVVNMKINAKLNKPNNNVKELKKQRAKLFKRAHQSQNLVRSQIDRNDKTIKYLLAPELKEMKKRQINSRRSWSQTPLADSQRSTRKLFPSRPNFNKTICNNQSNLTVKGWEADQAQLEQGLNFSTNSKNRLKI